MSRGKGGKKKKAVAAKTKECSCLLHPGEKSAAVEDFLKSLAPDIMLVEPPPGEAVSVVSVLGMLVDGAKEVIFKLIHMVFREFEAGICFQPLSLSNLYITQDGLVKIKDDTTQDKSDELIEENARALANIIHDLVFFSSQRYQMDSLKVNPELRHLLGLLRGYKPGKSTFLIKYPPCNVPLSNWPAYYLAMHDHVLQIIRWDYPGLFGCIMAALEIPADWYSGLETNECVREFLEKGSYDPKGTKASTVPDIEPLRCFRNISSHSREGAASAHIKNIKKFGPNASDPSVFTRNDLSRAMYSRAPMVLCSMAKALDAAGELCKLGIENLFPGRLQVIKLPLPN